MIRILSRLLNRSPNPGDRKDPPMPDPTAIATAPLDLTAQLSAQLGALTEAMRQLAESQKKLVESTKPAPAPSPAPSPSPTISGDPIGGTSPGALSAIDYSKLSPLQQITLGLRSAAPAPARIPASGAD